MNPLLVHGNQVHGVLSILHFDSGDFLFQMRSPRIGPDRPWFENNSPNPYIGIKIGISFDTFGSISGFKEWSCFHAPF